MTSQQLQDRWDQATRMYPVQTFERAGTTWRYRASGDGEHTLIVLPGALGGASAYFVLMTGYLLFLTAKIVESRKWR